MPASWLARGGVILPMHQAEALWLSFDTDYPMAVKVAAGKINAVSGKDWSTRLHGPKNPPTGYRARAAHHQDYLVLPEQPWLDGFNVATGQIRQFVAMLLGGGHTAEEQITGRAEVRGIQLPEQLGRTRSRHRRHGRGQRVVSEALSSLLEGRALRDGGCT